MYNIHIFIKGYKHGVCQKKINYNNWLVMIITIILITQFLCKFLGDKEVFS